MEKLNIGTYSLGGGFGGPSVPLLDQLKQARAMGYTGIEFLENDLRNNSVEDIKAWCAEAGIEPVGVHCQPDAIPEIVPIMAAVGGQMVVTPQMAFYDKESAIAFAKKLNEYGKEAKEKYGIKVGYHNHSNEFWIDEGKYLEDYIIENTDPEYVGIQLDAGWCANAGVNPVEYVKANLGRFISIHVKENNKALGAEKPQPQTGRPPMPPMKMGPDGKPIMDEETKKRMAEMMARMNERMSNQCPMGDPSSNIDWKALKALTDSQNNNCAWTVEREYDYKNGNKAACVAEDAAWLLANL